MLVDEGAYGATINHGLATAVAPGTDHFEHFASTLFANRPSLLDGTAGGDGVFHPKNFHAIQLEPLVHLDDLVFTFTLRTNEGIREAEMDGEKDSNAHCAVFRADDFDRAFSERLYPWKSKLSQVRTHIIRSPDIIEGDQSAIKEP